MNAIIQFKDVNGLKAVLAKEYMKQIENYFGDPKLALEFLSGVSASVQRTPALLECAPETLLNSFVVMASLKLMPSGVSGEAYVLPYRNKGVMEAQFQLGYQGLVTLFYRAGAKTIIAEIVRKNDPFSYENGEVRHNPDVFADDRGEPIGAYVIVELQSGGRITKVMSKKDITAIGEKFSKSYKSDFSPWKSNDPELWMWKKTVLKQAAKLVPKNETIYKALAEDNKDSVIGDKPTSNWETPETPSVDAEKHRAELMGCKTPEELDRVWADMPAQAKALLRPNLEQVKAKLAEAGTVV